MPIWHTPILDDEVRSESLGVIMAQHPDDEDSGPFYLAAFSLIIGTLTLLTAILLMVHAS